MKKIGLLAMIAIMTIISLVSCSKPPYVLISDKEAAGMGFNYRINYFSWQKINGVTRKFSNLTFYVKNYKTQHNDGSLRIKGIYIKAHPVNKYYDCNVSYYKKGDGLQKQNKLTLRIGSWLEATTRSWWYNPDGLIYYEAHFDVTSIR